MIIFGCYAYGHEDIICQVAEHQIEIAPQISILMAVVLLIFC